MARHGTGHFVTGVVGFSFLFFHFDSLVLPYFLRASLVYDRTGLTWHSPLFFFLYFPPLKKTVFTCLHQPSSRLPLIRFVFFILMNVL